MSLEIKKNISLKPWSWWKVGGEAEYCCFPKNLEELKEACHFSKEKNIPIYVLSGGTNTLISDKGISGLVIILKNLNSIDLKESENSISISSLSGTPKHELFKIFSQYKQASAYFLCGIPGDVGGGVVMNAGISNTCFPKEFSEIVEWIEVIHFSDCKLHFYKKEDLQWKYRSCTGWGDGVIYRVGFYWEKKKEENFGRKLKEFHLRRVTTQPLNKPSCGSVFKNPEKHKAGQLIEKLDLKGYSIGDAEVSTKHANFIINKGNAKAIDIYQIICHIQEKVKENFNVSLEPEIHFMGNWDKFDNKNEITK